MPVSFWYLSLFVEMIYLLSGCKGSWKEPGTWGWDRPKSRDTLGPLGASDGMLEAWFNGKSLAPLLSWKFLEGIDWPGRDAFPWPRRWSAHGSCPINACYYLVVYLFTGLLFHFLMRTWLARAGDWLIFLLVYLPGPPSVALRVACAQSRWVHEGNTVEGLAKRPGTTRSCFLTDSAQHPCEVAITDTDGHRQCSRF